MNTNTFLDDSFIEQTYNTVQNRNKWLNDNMLGFEVNKKTQLLIKEQQALNTLSLQLQKIKQIKKQFAQLDA